MGSRSEVIGTALADTRQRRGLTWEVMVQTGVADNFALDEDMPPVLALSGPTGGGDVLMPADSAALKGRMLTIINIATVGTLTLKTSADAALTPAVAVTVNNSATMIHLGGTGLQGWRRLDSL